MSAVIVEEQIDDGGAKRGVRHEILAWHWQLPRLAVSSYSESTGGDINFFTQEGGRSQNAPIRREPGKRVTAVQWHPLTDFIAVGWADGEVTIRKVDANEETLVQHTEISIDTVFALHWTPTGQQLFITYQNGNVELVKVDQHRLSASTVTDHWQFVEEVRCSCIRELQSGMEQMTAETQNDALDNFVKTRKTETTPGQAKVNRYQCVFGGAAGGIHAIFDDATSGKAEKPILQMLDFKEKSLLVAVTEDLMLLQIAVNGPGKAVEKLRMKLPGKSVALRIIFTEPGLLAINGGDNQIRLWDMISEDNGVISLLPAKGFASADHITCLSYSRRKGLSAGTAQGKIATWHRRTAISEDDGLENQWKLQTGIVVGLPIQSIAWSPVSSSLAVCTGQAVTILREQSTLAHLNDKVAVVQVGQLSMSIVRLEPPESQELKLKTPIRGAYITAKAMVVWDGVMVSVYELTVSATSPTQATFTATFPCAALEAALAQQNVYTLEHEKVNVRTFQGTVKQVLTLPEIEGDPMQIDVRGTFMCLATSQGFVRIYDLSRREAREQYRAKYVVEAFIAEFEQFASVKMNCAGNRVSCTFRSVNNVMNKRLLVWDAESDAVGFFDCRTGMTDQQQYEMESEGGIGARPKTAAAKKIEQQKTRYSLPDHSPAVHYWDIHDPRFLVCEANHTLNDTETHYLITMFVTSDHGVQVQDLLRKSLRCDSLLCVEVPFLYFLKKADCDEEDNAFERSVSRVLVRRVLREFAGLEDCDEKTRDSMLDFSFYLTVGQMDDAFKAIKFIKSESVWEHMAHMCVKTRRLDVAAVCLGNMGHARAARALRRSMKEDKEPEVQVATLAIQLGLLEEAQALYASCGRFDLVNRLLQAQCEWNPAFEVAERHDRIHLRNTYYAYASHLESMGAIDGAIENYEKSDTHRFEVPRMLFDNPKTLEPYIRKRRDTYVGHWGKHVFRKLQKWWAQYLESIGEIGAARGFYQAAKDYLAVVRLLCSAGDIEEACQVANETGSRAACFHLARFYENQEDHEEAVNYFTKAHAIGNAIRIAREQEMKDKLANLAMMSGENDMIEAAKFYEELPGEADKAIMLYHKAGMIGRALDLAFRTEQFSALDLIAKELDENSDPQVLERAVEFFSQNQQYDKSIRFLAYAKKYREAIELCDRKNVPITEDVAELLTPKKEAFPNPIDRTKLIEQLADCCMQQGNYYMAAKKYTQAGAKLQVSGNLKTNNFFKAMRALLKSGDTDKIIFFANTARSKDIFILAANYLQTVNWKDDVVVMKHIETFYTKAQAFDSLASFYEACAQVEIDDYRDYEKAASALMEAQRTLAKAVSAEKRSAFDMTERQEQLNKTISYMRKFLEIRSTYQTDPTDAIRQLTQLMDDPEVGQAIRLGDLYSIVILHNVKGHNHKKALALVERLRKQQPHVDITAYVKPTILDAIYDEMKLPRITAKPTDGDEVGGDEAAIAVDFSIAMRREMHKQAMDNAGDD